MYICMVYKIIAAHDNHKQHQSATIQTWSNRPRSKCLCWYYKWFIGYHYNYIKEYTYGVLHCVQPYMQSVNSKKSICMA